VVTATQFALENLGQPLSNAALLGGFAALTHQITLEALDWALRDRFESVVGERSAAVGAAAFRYITGKKEELQLAIVRWIERAYHRRRRQRALATMTPIEFEALDRALKAA
jgi:hypothetical protein